MGGIAEVVDLGHALDAPARRAADEIGDAGVAFPPVLVGVDAGRRLRGRTWLVRFTRDGYEDADVKWGVEVIGNHGAKPGGLRALQLLAKKSRRVGDTAYNGQH